MTAQRPTTTDREPGWRRTARTAQSRLERVHRFARDYTSGLKADDLQRLFNRDAASAYRVLVRDQAEPPTAAGGARLSLHQLKRLFLGLSYKLSPPRRLLFVASLVLTTIGLVRSEIIALDGGLQIDGTPLLSLAGFGLLLLLLVLELVDRVHVRDELELARELQHGLLPHAPPDLPGYSFVFSYRTANEVGGDYYDFLPVVEPGLDPGQEPAPHRLAVIVGDASGHGIGAGILMAIVNATLKLAIELDPAPEAVARLVNRVLVRTGDRRAFMTLFYGLLDADTGRMDYICAGHPFPLLRRADGEILEVGTGCLPLGLRDHLRLEPHSVDIRPGDLLVLSSDGIPEAIHRASATDFGFDRLRRLVEPGGTPQQVHDRIMADLDLFLRGEPRADDVSLVVMSREVVLPPVPGRG